MTKLTTEQSHALKGVVRTRIMMWDAATEAEAILDQDINTSREELDILCAEIRASEDIDKLSDEDLIRAFCL